jgi:hypothetical protein
MFVVNVYPMSQCHIELLCGAALAGTPVFDVTASGFAALYICTLGDVMSSCHELKQGSYRCMQHRFVENVIEQRR